MDSRERPARWPSSKREVRACSRLAEGVREEWMESGSIVTDDSQELADVRAGGEGRERRVRPDVKAGWMCYLL